MIQKLTLPIWSTLRKKSIKGMHSPRWRLTAVRNKWITSILMTLARIIGERFRFDWRPKRVPFLLFFFFWISCTSTACHSMLKGPALFLTWSYGTSGRHRRAPLKPSRRTTLAGLRPERTANFDAHMSRCFTHTYRKKIVSREIKLCELSHLKT